LDGTRVILNEAVVTAATYEVGRCCYVEHADRSAGIKVMGRSLARGERVVVYGVMGTVAGERVITSTAVEMLGDGEATPLSLPNRSFALGGPNITGLLVRTWGRVQSADQVSGSFTVSDGSGSVVECAAPRDPVNGTDPDPSFAPPEIGQFVVVTGISSSGLMLRDQDDLVVAAP